MSLDEDSGSNFHIHPSSFREAALLNEDLQATLPLGTF